MRLIKKMSEMIEEELEDAEEYAKCALRHKEDDPVLSRTFHEMSEQELHHAEMLHTEVVRIIAEHRKAHGEPPAAMLAVWEYLHERHIEKANAVRMLLGQMSG